MISADALPSVRRAELIYANARSGIDTRLWRAALGSEAGRADRAKDATAIPALSLDTLLALFADKRSDTAAAATAAPVSAASIPVARAPLAVSPEPVAGLGSNVRYAATIGAAATRTGVPAGALAAIIDAEAAKDRYGNWQPGSRNSRSSAVGLGQFLSGTWTSEAERTGTWLNGIARENAWLGSDGRILQDARTALLAFRQDAHASINATADYARRSLDKLARSGVAIGETVEQIAQAAYLGHNLGLGDAIKFLRGELDEGRARLLLDAQVGAARAARRVAAAGNAVAAHRGWLTDFIGRHVQADRFSG